MAAAKYGRSSGSYWYVGSSSLTAYPSPSGTRKRPWPVSTTASLCGSNRRASRQVTRCAPRWPSGRAARTTARRIPSCTCACTPPRTSYTRRHGRGPRRMRSSRIPRGSGKDRGTVLGLHHRRSNDNECGHPTVNPQLLAQIRSSSPRSGPAPAAHAACLAAACAAAWLAFQHGWRWNDDGAWTRFTSEQADPATGAVYTEGQELAVVVDTREQAAELNAAIPGPAVSRQLRRQHPDGDNPGRPADR